MSQDYYSVVWDGGEQFERFYTLHLSAFADNPDLAFIVLSFARKKYNPQQEGSCIRLDTSLYRAQSGSRALLSALQRYECPVGTFCDKADKPIADGALAFYITLNPCNEVKAFIELSKSMLERMHHRLLSAEQVRRGFNVVEQYKSELHKKSSSRFQMLDVDSKNAEQIARLQAMLRNNQISLHLVVESKNGYHVILDNCNSYGNPRTSRAALNRFIDENKQWLSLMKGNPNLVIPGTIQGGFTTRLIEAGAQGQAWPFIDRQINNAD